MSLPPAPKDISDHPQPGSVVDPVNKVLKDADVDRKLRFYGVIEALRQGRLPDNDQIDRTLKYVRDNSPVDISKLSPEGQKLIEDARDIVESARLMVKDKNADELFQNFMWHTRNVDYDAAKKDPNDVLPVDKAKAQNDSRQAVQHLRTLLNLILTNSEVRKFLTDFSLIGRDLLARGAVKAAENIRPSDERMATVDQPGAANEFQTAGGRTAGPNETPILEAKIPGTDTTVRQHPKEDLGRGAEIETGNGNVRSGADAMQDAQSQKDRLQAEGVDRVQKHKNDVQQQVDSIPDDAPDAQDRKADVAKTGLREKLTGFRDGLMDRIPQEHKDRAGDQLDRSKHFLLDEYFPEDRRDQFVYRGKRVIIECQKHKDYQESVQWLLGFLEEYGGHGQTVAGTARDSHGQISEDPALQIAMTELRTLLERFANGKSMSGIFDAAQALYNDTQNDEELRNWFKAVDSFVHKTLLEPGYVLREECNDQGNQLIDSGRQFYDGKYKANFDNLFNACGEWFAAMGDDPLNKRFGEDWARLTKDLLFDSEGSLKFKPELWNDIRQVIMPTLIDQVGYIPIPRIEYTDDSLDLVVENLTLSGRNLFPNVVSLEAHNFMRFSPYNAMKDERHHDFTFTLGQMQADMRDVMFYFRRKTGLGKMTDSGIADVILGGEGLTATIHLVSAENDKSSVFKVKNVHVKVDTLKFSIRESKHDFLYKTLRPLATGLVKKQIQKALEASIRTGLEYVDGQLVGVRDRMAEAKGSEDKTRMQVLQEMFQRKKDEAASVRSGSTRHSQFKVVAKRDSVLLPDKGNPAGWVNRQQERQDAATQGEEWRSKAFTIV